MSNNMEAFDRGTALIFSRLYDVFPKRIALNIEELDEKATEEEKALYGEAAAFLCAEGFIRFAETYYGDSNSLETLIGAQLTSKGLAVLKAIPTSIETKRSIIDVTKDALKSGSNEFLSKTISELITKGLSISLATFTS